MSNRIFLVDDHDYILDYMATLVAAIPDLILVGRETDPLVALKKIVSKEIVADIIFLDVDMPGLNGIDLAESIKNYAALVFTTGYTNFAHLAFKVDAVDYLMKPVTLETFESAIKKASVWLKNKRLNAKPKTDFLIVPGDGKNVHIKIDKKDILYIKGSSNYSQINTHQREYLTNRMIKEISGELSELPFFRIHKSYIINVNKMIKVDTNTVYLEEGTELPISETYRREFMAAIGANR
ncbi:LytR/AlgR family response regulator transcription factor [Pedobacter sp. GR22-10]|uniref:LytR/AlgR family response regulator transcription factor n=1 Tax=Pedobacter sp. GR22-10 TaxID=2994472 RepID=UPI00224791D4|nr:LytTR family DNA-binding domain-containing protein [Pedobacter sp. GR22-10]MCX2429905.1 LytTR family DNA-binding domain-containing protein [Pedobacter sp. GR22-10]